MPKLTIDGMEVTVEPGTSIIQAAEQLDRDPTGGRFSRRSGAHDGLEIIRQSSRRREHTGIIRRDAVVT